MYGALTVIVLALAGCSALTARAAPSSTGRQHVQAFLYVGAGALVLLAVAVIAVGVTASSSGRAEALAIFGCFTYVLYLLAALTLGELRGRR